LRSRRRHCRRWFFHRLGPGASIFLHLFAPRALPRFKARMGALTPARAVLRLCEHERRVCPRRSPCLMDRAFRPFRLQPPLVVLRSRFGFRIAGLPPRSYRTHPPGRVPHGVSWASPLTRRLATTTGRIEFVILRTGRSPPVAPHAASRRRSYVRLQGSNLNLDEDFHLADSIHFTSARVLRLRRR